MCVLVYSYCYILVGISLLELSRLRPAPGILTPGAEFEENTKYCCMCVLALVYSYYYTLVCISLLELWRLGRAPASLHPPALSWR